MVASPTHNSKPIEHSARAVDPLTNDLLHPREGSPVASVDSPGRFAAWCQRNKFPLMALPAQDAALLAHDDSFRSALEAERNWYRTQRDEYQLVRDAWSARGIDSLMIKTAGNDPAFPHTSDNIDILIRPSDGVAARLILRQMGYVEVRNVEEPQKFLFRRFHDGACVSAIHVHEQIAWFVGFLDDTQVWSRSRIADDDPDVTIPSPEDVILINIAHACYENKELRLNDVVRIRHALLACGGDLDWDYLRSVARLRGWEDGLAYMVLVYAWVAESIYGTSLISCMQLGTFEQQAVTDRHVWAQLQRIRSAERVALPLDLSYPFCKRLYYRKIMADTCRDRRERWRDVAVTLIWGVKLKSRLRPQRGFVVSISGPDGSGKTTHAEALINAMRTCGLKPRYVWSRGGSTGLFALAHRVRRRGRRGGSNLEHDAVARRRSRLKHPVVRFIWAWLVAGDQIATTFSRSFVPSRFGRIIVTDRSSVDTVVELDATLPADDKWSRRAIDALVRFAPRSDIGFVLDVSRTTVQRRKPNEVLHMTFDQERTAYQRLASQMGLRMISTEGDFAVSSDPLIQQTIMAFMDRYETRLNGLLYSNPSQKNDPDPDWKTGAWAGRSMS